MGYTGKLKKSALYIGTEEDNSELLPGTEGQILSVDSSGNLDWVNPPSSGGWTLVLDDTFSSVNEIIINDIGLYKFYKLIVLDMTTVNQGTVDSNIFIRLSDDNGLTFYDNDYNFNSDLITIKSANASGAISGLDFVCIEMNFSNFNTNLINPVVFGHTIYHHSSTFSGGGNQSIFGQCPEMNANAILIKFTNSVAVMSGRYILYGMN